MLSFKVKYVFIFSHEGSKAQRNRKKTFVLFRAFEPSWLKMSLSLSIHLRYLYGN